MIVGCGTGHLIFRPSIETALLSKYARTDSDEVLQDSTSSAGSCH